MVSLLTDKTLKSTFGVTDDKEMLIEFDKRFATLAKNKGRLQPLKNYLKVGVNDETDAPIYLAILKPNGEIATLDEYKEHQIKTANVELERIIQEKTKLENEIAKLQIKNAKLTDESWLIRDDYARVAVEFDELGDLLEDLKNETKQERRKLKKKIFREIQQMSFFDKLKFLIR